MDRIRKKLVIILIFMMVMMNTQLLLVISEATDQIERIINGYKIEPFYEMNLEKYVNYKIQTDTGVVLQVNFKTGVKREENQEYHPLKLTKTFLEAPKIENQYPKSVEVIGKSTKATNGSETAKDFQYDYNNETGKLEIIVENKQEENEDVNKDKVEEARDEYTIIFYYDSNCYNDTNLERDIKISGSVQIELENDQEVVEKIEIEQNDKVTENISGLISTNVATSNVYNGYIKANSQNGTQYQTEYSETLEINVSKKEIANEMIIKEQHSIDNENSVADPIVYHSTKINKNDVLAILGEDGYLQILNEKGDILRRNNERYTSRRK